MFEKVNPAHPDKVADRIAGAIVDLGYQKEENPKIAVEVLIGHGECNIIIESSCEYGRCEIIDVVRRIAGDDISVNLNANKQDKILAGNQEDSIKCGDNGIFRGMPVTAEQQGLSQFAMKLYEKYPYDGKHIFDTRGRMVVCQSNVKTEEIAAMMNEGIPGLIINPLGDWTGGINVDAGATNRKLGSDMADSVTGGGLHGKDLSKGDVSINIYAWLKAQETGKPVEICCAIGDETVDGKPYSEIVEIARNFIENVGGFEKFAEWGLV